MQLRKETWNSSRCSYNTEPESTTPLPGTGGATALQLAAIKGYIGIARKLIDLGANVNEGPAESNGRTALQGAAEYGRIDMLQVLFNEGVLVVDDGEPHYHKAVELAEHNGHKTAARLLRHFRNLAEVR